MRSRQQRLMRTYVVGSKGLAFGVALYVSIDNVSKVPPARRHTDDAPASSPLLLSMHDAPTYPPACIFDCIHVCRYQYTVHEVDHLLINMNNIKDVKSSAFPLRLRFTRTADVGCCLSILIRLAR